MTNICNRGKYKICGRKGSTHHAYEFLCQIKRQLKILQTFTQENSFGLDSSGARQTIRLMPDGSSYE